ncbi:universal stress protein [Natronosalvus vescus]|uniref:universal stress protein n=1 Tax=Natronosalvus vescus TaxID=2953881 RepID=UPI002091B141|nr:universal stress protein [Natronosalvus vescus]
MSVLVAVDIDQAPQRPITVGYNLATALDETLIVMYVMPQKEYDEQRNSRDELPEEISQQEFTLDQAIDSAAQLAATTVDEREPAVETSRR